MNRRLRTLVPASLALAVIALSACGSNQSSPEPSASPAAATPSATAEATPTPTAAPSKSSPNLDGIVVEGAKGQMPTVKIPTPFGVDQTMTKVLIPGDGATVAAGGSATLHYAGFNGRTGEKFDDSYSRGAPVPFSLDQVVPGFSKGLAGQRVGSRVLIAMPGVDGYDAGGGNPQINVQLGDTLVFVVDITDAPLERATGDPVAPPAGLPTVEFAGDKPKITIPAGVPAPTQLVVQPLIVGKGKPVAATDAVTAHYQAVLWKNGEVVEDTFGGKAETAALSTLIPAWQEALVNRTVGSRLLIVSPPDKAYPLDPGARRPNPAAGETVVYVVDILQTQAGQ